MLCNIVLTFFQHYETLFRRCFNVVVGRWINVVQRCKTDVGFCFIFNVGSTLFQRWSTMLKKWWSDVKILTGKSVTMFRMPLLAFIFVFLFLFLFVFFILFYAIHVSMSFKLIVYQFNLEKLNHYEGVRKLVLS